MNINVLDQLTNLSSTFSNPLKESATLNLTSPIDLKDSLGLVVGSHSLNHSRTIASTDLEMKADYDYDGRSSLTATVSLSASPSSATETNPISGTGTGLKGEYFTGRAFDVLKLTRTDSTVNFNWKKGSPDASLAADNFSVRWIGQVQPKYSDTYTFYTTSDDGIRLWVDGKQLINNWTTHAATENKGSLSLIAGQKYDLKLEYFEKGGDAVSRLMWFSPNQLKEVISQSQLYSLVTPPLDMNDKPVIMVPGSQSIASGTTLSISGLQITDPDAGNGELLVTLNATNGTLHLNETVSGGVTMANIKNNGTGSIVLIGTLMQIAATLASPTGLIYAANSGFFGSDTINVTVNDNGYSGAGGPQIDSQSFAVTTYATESTNQSIIGTNLNGISDWSTEWPFVDVFKTSREWIPQREGASWGAGGTLKLTPEGWVAALEPGQYAETIMMIDSKHYPTGQYTLLYEGEGQIAFRFGSSKIVSSAPGKMLVDVTQGEGVFLQIRATNPDNPIRNIRFIMPGFENTYQTQPFHPIFLERLSKFSTLRFMDWMATNNSDIANWSDRNTPASVSQAGPKGVALEYMIQLANTLKIDPWFSIPGKASDDYVRQFATMVRDRLDPSLQAHIEYSNEVWNGMFSQSRYASEQGIARKLDTTNYSAALRFYSERSVEIFNIFDNVFGTSVDKRVVKVLSGQAGNPWTASQILGWKDAYKSADAYAIAPYFDGSDADKNGESDLNEASKVDATLKMTSDQIIDSFLAEIPTEIKLMFDNNYNVATKQFGLPLYAYEGGSHLTAYQFPGDKVEQVTTLFAEANRHPRMRDVYREYLNQWQKSGGLVFNQFTSVYSPNKWGFWGAMEYQNQELSQAPKYQGLIDFINANQR